MDSRSQFEALYQAHAGAVLAFARRRCSESTADDVVADVFLIVWRRLEDVPAEPLPWLLGVATRVLANTRRGEGRAGALSERLAGEQLAGARAGAEGSSDSALLVALRSLPERDQQVLLLVAWDGLERAQAAQVLGIGTSAFAVRLHRARKRLVKARAVHEAGQRDPAEHSTVTEVL